MLQSTSASVFYVLLVSFYIHGSKHLAYLTWNYKAINTHSIQYILYTKTKEQ